MSGRAFVSGFPLAAFVLSAVPARGAGPAVQVRTSCVVLDEEIRQAIEILRAELAADGTVCCAAPNKEGTGSQVALTPLPCSSPRAVEASIQKGDAPPARRLISLHDVRETARARVIALAVAEALRSEAPMHAAARGRSTPPAHDAPSAHDAARAQAATPAHDATRAQAAAPAQDVARAQPAARADEGAPAQAAAWVSTDPAPVKPATSSPGRSGAPWSFDAGLGVAGRAYPFTGTSLTGLAAFAALGPGEGSWHLRLGLEGSRTRAQEAGGEVSLRVGWATLALARTARVGPVRLGWGPQLEFGWGQVRGQVSSPNVGAGEGSHGLVALGAQADASLPLGHGFLAWSALGVSGLLGGLDATVDDRRVLGARYLQLALSVGFGWGRG